MDTATKHRPHKTNIPRINHLHDIQFVVNIIDIQLTHTQVVCVVVLLHGSETWPVKKKNELTRQ